MDKIRIRGGRPLSGTIPIGGAKNAAISREALDDMIRDLEARLAVGPLGMQVMEDAICNWQKSPANYKLFTG